jgi:Predicted membrane protein (DUF2142)
MRPTVAIVLRRVTRRVPPAVALASVLLFLVSLAWAVVTPALRGADEGAHLNSVVRLAEGGGWPQPGDARYEDEIRDVTALSAAAQGGRRTVFPRATTADDTRPRFTDRQPLPPAARPSLHALDDGPDPAWADQMTQHPPGYYAVAAAVYRLAGAGDWRYDRALLLLRALTALTVAAVLPVCCFAAARDLTGSEPVGVLAAFVPLLVPQLHFLGGTATNDGLTIATTAVVWALAVRVLCAGPTRRRLLLLALAMGAACWTKGTALTLLPVIVLAVALGYRRLRGPGSWVRPALGGVVGVGVLAGVLGGWWWVLNVIRYGGLQPSGFTPVEIPAGSFDPMGLPAYLWLFVARIRWTFFLEVGGRQPADLDGLTAVLAVAFTVLCVAGVVALRRAGDRAVLLLGIAGMTGLLFHTTYTAHLASGLLPGIQGRYLFVLLVPIAVLAAAGLARLAAAARPVQRWLPAGGALAGGGVAALGLALGLRIHYGELDEGWADAVHRFLLWVPVPCYAVAALGTTLLLAGLAQAVAAARRRLPGAPARVEPVAREIPVTDSA